MRNHVLTQDGAGNPAKTARLVRGLQEVYRMAGILLAEHVPPSGRVMVLGAVGGLELSVFANMQPG